MGRKTFQGEDRNEEVRDGYSDEAPGAAQGIKTLGIETIGVENAAETTREVERENLPEEVEPGVTYRDVRVRWTARASIVHPTDGDDAA